MIFMTLSSEKVYATIY